MIAAGACAGGHAASTAPGTVVRISEGDFRISAPPHIRAGDVRLVVRNHGPDNHELILVRAEDAQLPLRRDAETVDEEALEPVAVGALEPGPPGSVRELDVHLTPGTYELFCNMEGHYLGGMSAILTVE